MLAFRNTSEQDIEIEIAALERELAKLSPFPLTTALPAFTLIDKNVISVPFNTLASPAMNAYVADLPRRRGLERRLETLRRRLNALRAHRVYAAHFPLAA